MDDNPYVSSAALRHSHYYHLKDGRAVLHAGPHPPPDLFAAAAIGAFRGFVLDPQFSCVGAKNAVANETLRFGVYDRLGSVESAAGLARDLFTFTHEPPEFTEADYITFVAIFQEPAGLDEEQFERLLWDELRALHRLDRPLHDWDPAVSDDPNDPHFAFSFSETAFFVVGLHPNSSRVARQFPWPALVFNPHAQFERLKKAVQWERLQDVIRNREENLQGAVNPNLADFGEESEARQYSGREVEPDWTPPSLDNTASRGCPFGHSAPDAGEAKA